MASPLNINVSPSINKDCQTASWAMVMAGFEGDKQVINHQSSGISSANVCGTSKEGPRYTVFSSMSSVEDSPPSSPIFGPAPNFAEVAPGIYRSSFPKAGNFDHLRSLGLKSVLTLVPEEYPTENVRFLHENNIQHFQIPIPAHKDPFVTIPRENIAKTLSILSDHRNLPILIHCNKGKHRTGCIVACFRKLNDWTIPAIIAEYRHFASTKARILDERFIEGFNEGIIMTSTSNEASFNMASHSELLTPPSSVKDDPKDDSPLVTRAWRVESKVSEFNLS